VILIQAIYCENVKKSKNIPEVKDQINISDRSDFGNNFLLVDIIKFLPVKNATHQCYTNLKLLKYEIDNHQIWAMKGLIEIFQ